MNDIKSRIENPPKYKIGEAVQLYIKSRNEKTGFEFNNKVEGIISSIKASGTSEKDTYEYGITRDMPGCYYNGEAPFQYIMEDSIVLVNTKDSIPNSSHGWCNNFRGFIQYRYLIENE